MEDDPRDIVVDRALTHSLSELRHTKGSIEYWLARELQQVLGYERWEHFEEVVERARRSCDATGSDPRHHFLGVAKKVNIGSGAARRISDVALSRYACYLTAMNGDPTKPEIASAQAYFAIQTRRQEQADELDEVEARIKLRDRIKQDVKLLNDAAKEAGVEDYARFHGAGYRGLYGDIGLTQVKQEKGLDPSEDLMDRAGRTELAANDFRITQTEGVLIRGEIKGDLPARNTHYRVGKEVRQTIEKLGGEMPEKLPPAPSIKKLASGRKRTSLPPPQS